MENQLVKKINNVTSVLAWLLVAGMMLGLNACEVVDFPPHGGPHSGNTYYVSPNGDDSNSGSKKEPFKTVQQGVDTAQAGDKVFIREGSYNEVVTVSNSGTEGNPLVISGYPKETVTIDGENNLPTGEYPGAKWKAMFTVSGDYVEVKNLTVKNSRGRGVQVQDANQVLISKINSDHNWNAGIHVLRSTHTTVENSKAWENASSNAPPNRGEGGWPATLMLVESENCIVRGNEVYRNHGEGIDDLKSTHSVIEGNVAYDNYKINIYLDNSQYSLVQGNLVYHTDNKEFWRYADYSTPRPSPGIVLNDEDHYDNMNPATGNIIINNMVYNTGSAIAIWAINDAEDVLVANNTIVNILTGATGNESEGILVRNAVIANSVITNNVVYHENYGPLVTGPTNGITFSHNNWSSLVGDSYAGTGDVVEDPDLALAGNTGAGELTGEFFELTGSSPVLDAAKKLNEVTEDFFGKKRGGKPDMGAHEYRGERYGDPSDSTDQGPGDLVTETFTPVADSYTIEGQPDANKGSANTINSNSAVGYRKYPFLKFDVSGIDGTVEEAVLKLHVDQGTANGTSTVWSNATTDWSDDGITWNNQPSEDVAVGNFYNDTTGTTVEIPIDAAYVSGDGTYSLVIIANSSAGRIDYVSRDHSTSSYHPVLEISYSSE